MLPPDVAGFRARFAAKYISPRYSGWAHFAFTSIVALSIIGYCIARVRQLHALELMTVT